MFTTLDQLKEQELRIYPSEEVAKVLDALYKVSLSQMVDYVSATEKLDSYLFFVDIINERVYCDDLKTVSEDKKSELLQNIEKLRERLNDMKIICIHMHYNQRSISSYVEDKQKETDVMVKQITKELTDKIGKATEKLEDSEHNILTHVLTLMGVFSAIIITIMSVVITTTSWLNNADGSEVITAFVVPLGVTSITVILLLMVVYGLYGDRKGRRSFYIYISIVLIVLLAMICQYKYMLDKNGKVIHTRYMIEQSEYEIMESDNVQCYKFMIDDVEYVCPYDDVFLHNDSSLHFCTLHKQLE